MIVPTIFKPIFDKPVDMASTDSLERSFNGARGGPMSKLVNKVIAVFIVSTYPPMKLQNSSKYINNGKKSLIIFTNHVEVYFFLFHSRNFDFP